jgi:hypothetical protein
MLPERTEVKERYRARLPHLSHASLPIDTRSHTEQRQVHMRSVRLIQPSTAARAANVSCARARIAVRIGGASGEGGKP